jgi:hypothetical protein
MSDSKLEEAFLYFKNAMYKHYGWVNPAINSRQELEDEGRINTTPRVIDAFECLQTLEAIVLKQNKKRKP